ncbi:MAG TPA: hypothetical protein VE592_09375 [Geminicoccaceae bacterium]|jgi:hypothetical protein|nr:hypothetical protein [Geminicoccaceae bacterium]
MNHDAIGSRPLAPCLVAVIALVGLAAVGCSDQTVEEGGLLESQTHQSDALRRAEERQEQNRSRNGGGGY